MAIVPRVRITQPPPSGNASLDRWYGQVADALNVLPAFSFSSTTNGPNSVVTAESGTFLFDFGSSATTLWFKCSGTGNSGWSAVGFA